MTDTAKSPAQHASDAAEAIRALNHATLSLPGSDGWEFPADAYSVIGGLERMAGMLPQALEQVSRFLYDLQADGHVGSDHGDHQAANEVITARGELRKAREVVAQLAEALGRAHSATSALAYRE